jgi:hypothetical protein
MGEAAIYDAIAQVMQVAGLAPAPHPMEAASLPAVLTPGSEIDAAGYAALIVASQLQEDGPGAYSEMWAHDLEVRVWVRLRIFDAQTSLRAAGGLGDALDLAVRRRSLWTAHGSLSAEVVGVARRLLSSGEILEVVSRVRVLELRDVSSVPPGS